MTTAEARTLLHKVQDLPAYKRASLTVRNYIRELVWAEREPVPTDRRSAADLAKAKSLIERAR